jgi:hypothetical protein
MASAKKLPIDKERGCQRVSHYGGDERQPDQGEGRDQTNGKVNEHPVYEMNRTNVTTLRIKINGSVATE